MMWTGIGKAGWGLGLVLALGVLAGSAGPASAQVVVLNNINFTGSAPNFAIGAAPPSAYVGFVAGTSQLNVSEVVIRAINKNTSGSSTVRLDLYSDSGTNPGSLISQIGTSQSITDTVNASFLVFTQTTSLSLTAGQTYWLALSTDSGSVGWFENGFHPPSTASGYSLVSTTKGNSSRTLTGGGFTTGAGGPNGGDFEFRLTATPEPSTWLMGGVVVACGGLTGWRRWRRARVPAKA